MTTFPPGFFSRADESPDAIFYEMDRLVTHLDDAAIAAVGELYTELGLEGDVLDLCASWVSHFPITPEHLVAIGMNVNELDANPALSEYLVHDLNADPVLPFPDASFDAVTCCASVDYLTRPIEVFGEVARVLRPGWSVRGDVLQSMLPDQGDPWLAGLRRSWSLHDRVGLLRFDCRLRRADDPTPHPTGRR